MYPLFACTGTSATVLTVLDSADPRCKFFDQVLLPMLRFWGAPLGILDLAALPPTLPDYRSIALVLVPQEGILPERMIPVTGLVDAACKAGAGVIILDPALEALWMDPQERLRIAARSWTGVYGIRSAKIVADHFIARLQRNFRSFEFAKPVPALPRTNGTVLLADFEGAPLLVLNEGYCRIVEWGLGLTVWTPNGLGFGRGLDALLWRSILWAARKPFAMAAFPPFGRFRFDDCRGLWHNPADLAFLDVMAEFGERPNLGVCLSALTNEGWQHLAARANKHEIEVSPHVQEPDVGIFNVAEQATEPAPCEDPLAVRIRDQFAGHGCCMATSVSDHNHELSSRGLRIARTLKMTSRMNVLRIGETWDGLHRDWRPAPFGRMNYALDHFIDAPDLFTAINHHPSFADSFTHLGDEHFLCTEFGGFTPDRWDFLNGLVGENGNDIEAAVERLLIHAELALNSLFFLGSISHTHFMRYLSAADWRRLLGAYHDFADPLGHVPRSYAEIAAYAEWRGELGNVAIAPEGTHSGEQPLWGLLATDGSEEPSLRWQMLSYWAAPNNGNIAQRQKSN